ncbi:hypothetical protein ACJZ2D_005562 [Fusarium nematophilum]
MQAATATTVIATEWVLLAAGAVLILARFHLRLRISRQRLVISDIFICLAWCSAVACSSFDIVFLRIGVLRPHVDSNLNGYDGHELQRILMYFWARGFPFFTAFYLYKAALLVFYVQMIPEFFTVYRAVLWGTIVYSGLGFIISVLLNLVICLPVERNWALDGTGCGEETVKLFHIAWALHFSSDIISELSLLLKPSHLDRKVDSHLLRIRLALYCVFGLGIIELAITLTRYVALNVPPDSSVPFTNIGKFCLSFLARSFVYVRASRCGRAADSPSSLP